MNTFLFVSIILGFFIILIIIFIVNREVKGSSNPIDSITKNGILGFELEDSKQSVLSRLDRLGLIYIGSMLGGYHLIGNKVITAKKVYNNIDYITLFFSTDNEYKTPRLSRIVMTFEDKGEGTKDFAEFLSIKLSTKFGKCTEEVIGEDDGYYTWFGEHIVLIYAKDDSNKKYIKLFIDGKRLW